MTKEERAEMKELFEDLLQITTTKHDEQYKMIDYKLDLIKEQTTKTNGRVLKLENKELVHISLCPLNEKVRTIEDNQLSSKSVQKWVVGSITITSIIVTVIMAIFKLFIL